MRSPVHLPCIASRCGAMVCPVGDPFCGAELYAPTRELGFCRASSMIVQCVCPPFVVLAHAPTGSTASVELVSAAEGAMAAKPKALEQWVGGEDGRGPGVATPQNCTPLRMQRRFDN